MYYISSKIEKLRIQVRDQQMVGPNNQYGLVDHVSLLYQLSNTVSLLRLNIC